MTETGRIYMVWYHKGLQLTINFLCLQQSVKKKKNCSSEKACMVSLNQSRPALALPLALSCNWESAGQFMTTCSPNSLRQFVLACQINQIWFWAKTRTTWLSAAVQYGSNTEKNRLSWLSESILYQPVSVISWSVWDLLSYCRNN